MGTISQWRQINGRTRDLSTLDRIDYSDVATIATDVRATPLDWARAVVERAAGTPAQVFWRAIGLRLDHVRPEHVGGWAIARRGDGWVVLETTSWYASINAVLEVGASGEVSLSLLARFDHPFAKVACPPITLIHRRGIGLLLRAAARHVGAGR